MDFEATAWGVDAKGVETATAGTLATYVVGQVLPVSTVAATPDQMYALGVLDHFGSDVAGMGSLSPTLMNDLSSYVQQGYTVEAIRGASVTDPGTHSIEIDVTNILDSKNEVIDGSWKIAIGEIAHEVGHAEFGPISSNTPQSTYIKQQELSEGRATIENVEVGKEIHDITGDDIFIESDSANTQKYVNLTLAYMKHPTSANLITVETKIGQIYDHNEWPTALNYGLPNSHTYDYDYMWTQNWKTLNGH